MLRADGATAYLYGEVTGYWLVWAARRAPCPRRLAAAVDFIEGQWTGGRPGTTRLGAVADWRNGALFSFDLAMMLRGLGAAARVLGPRRCRPAADAIRPWLDRLVAADGTLAACLPLSGATLPVRWSTQPGPFQAKTAAAILAAPGAWRSPRITLAAQATLERWRGRAAEHRAAHPRLYAVEGACLAAGGSPPLALLTARGEDDDDAPRADALAQRLRLLCLCPEAPAAVLEEAALELLPHVAEDGGLRFRVEDQAANVWAALFAEQAFRWFDRRKATGRLPDVRELV
ncbi:MAG: hypothetical protein MUC64_00660 [Rubritepida sp.]|nr:hypothetical protein [Rubritepida sp.]